MMFCHLLASAGSPSGWRYTIVRPGICGSPERLASSRKFGGSAGARASAPAERVKLKCPVGDPSANTASIATHGTRGCDISATSIPFGRSGKRVIDDASVATGNGGDLGHFGVRQL